MMTNTKLMRLPLPLMVGQQIFSVVPPPTSTDLKRHALQTVASEQDLRMPKRCSHRQSNWSDKS